MALNKITLIDIVRPIVYQVVSSIMPSIKGNDGNGTHGGTNNKGSDDHTGGSGTSHILPPASQAPSSTPSGGALQPGMMYYNLTESTLYLWNGTRWMIIGPEDESKEKKLNDELTDLQNQIDENEERHTKFVNQHLLFLGYSSQAPSTMLDGAGLIDGAMYYNSDTDRLCVYHDGVWNMQSRDSDFVNEEKGSNG